MKSIIDELADLQKEIDQKQAELDNLNKLFGLYPNLLKHTNRWKTVRYCSSDVNKNVNKCEIRHNCGCCSDSPLEIWPYLETDFGNIYSN